MQKNLENTGGLILAGGRSSRMGIYKAFLPFDQNQTFLDKLVSTYSDLGVRRIVVIINDTIKNRNDRYSAVVQNERVTILKNPTPEKGRLFSIRMGLREMREMDHVFLQNIDDPFTDGSVLRSLLNAADQSSYSVPTYNEKGGHPILLSNSIVGHIANIGNTDGNLKHVLSEFTRKNVATADPRVLLNINTPEEYSRQFGISPTRFEGSS